MRDSVDRNGAAGAARFLALGCIGLLTGTGPALAQDSTATAAQPRVLGGVTVTDTAITEGSYKTERAASPKYTAPLLDTPRTITVIPSQVLQDNATASLADALRFVPGITLGAGEGGNPRATARSFAARIRKTACSSTVCAISARNRAMSLPSIRSRWSRDRTAR
ncbi:TonB-dependent receptor plug domain-containing protein [Novosphingobium pokkalii]|uniref:TonB-dependent receptor plug domain-containing protein n=1 Tax=Novosphingobium pokkalii TaxID=1770194 RepID=UPI00363FF7BF